LVYCGLFCSGVIAKDETMKPLDINWHSIGPVSFMDHALAQAPAWDQIASQTIRKIYAEREIELKRLLSLWVSELEPCMILQGFKFLGLGWVDDPSPGRIIIPSSSKVNW